MTTYRKRSLYLRMLITSLGIITMAALLSPTLVLHRDAYAADAAPVPTKVAPTAPAAAAAAAAAAAPAALPPADAAVAGTAGEKPVGETKKEEPKEQSWWQAGLSYVLSAFGLFLAAFLVAGLRKLIQLIENKWKIDIPDSVEKLMAEKARWLVGWAEEKAEVRLLSGDGIKTEGAQKLTDVVDAMESFAKAQGYGDEWRRSKIEQLVEGVLHLERDVSVGSNGSRGQALAEKKDGNG